MNEVIFFLHAITVVLFALAALAIGKKTLFIFVSMQSVLANIFVVKQTTLFGFTVTCADCFIVGIVLSLNLISEFFGKEESKKAFYISFFSLAFFIAMSKFHLFYSPAPVDYAHSAFKTILTPFPRIAFASLAAFFISLFINNKIYASST